MISISYKDCSFSYKGKTVLSNLSFSIEKEQHYGIVGPIGSGKTMLLKSLNGLLPLVGGKRTFIDQDEELNPYEFSLISELVEFSESNKYFRPKQHFYQQRYQSLEDDESRSLLVKDYLNVQEIDIDEYAGILEKANITELFNRKLIHISSGQRKRLQLAIAITKKPKVLMLDFPYTGMDVSTRKEMNVWLEEVSKLFDIKLIIVANQSDLPSFVTGRIELQGSRVVDHDKAINALSSLKSLWGLQNSDNAFDNAIHMQEVELGYGGHKILKSLNWHVSREELVGLQGENGSGKSSLLSLIYGDNPLAYNKEIYLFDKKRGTGESIWDIKRNIGFVSSEFHLYMSDNITCGKLIATGYFDQLFIPRTLTEGEEETIGLYLTYFGVEDLKDRYFDQISIGEQRMVLLIRALIKNPPLLLLDEPYHCFDERTIKEANALLKSTIETTKNTLVFISHNISSMPEIIERNYTLIDGKIVES